MMFFDNILFVKNMKNKEIPYCLNSSKIQQKNCRNICKIDNTNTHIHMYMQSF